MCFYAQTISHYAYICKDVISPTFSRFLITSSLIFDYHLFSKTIFTTLQSQSGMYQESRNKVRERPPPPPPQTWKLYATYRENKRGPGQEQFRYNRPTWQALTIISLLLSLEERRVYFFPRRPPPPLPTSSKKGFYNF